MHVSKLVWKLFTMNKNPLISSCIPFCSKEFYWRCKDSRFSLKKNSSLKFVEIDLTSQIQVYISTAKTIFKLFNSCNYFLCALASTTKWIQWRCRTFEAACAILYAQKSTQWFLINLSIYMLMQDSTILWGTALY